MTSRVTSSPRLFITDLRKLTSSVEILNYFRSQPSTHSRLYNEETPHTASSSSSPSKFAVPPPKNLQFSANKGASAQQQLPQFSPQLVAPPQPAFTLAEATFIINAASRAARAAPSSSSSTTANSLPLNELILHSVDIVSVNVLAITSANNSNNNSNVHQSEYLVELGQTLVAAWNLINNHTTTSTATTTTTTATNSSKVDELWFEYLTTLRDAVFAKEKRALLSILATPSIFASASSSCSSSTSSGTEMRNPHGNNNNNNNNNNNYYNSSSTSSSSSSAPRPVHRFVADVIANDLLVDFHGRSNVREALAISASSGFLSFLDVFNLYKIVVETKTGSCGMLKQQLYGLVCDSWKGSQLTSQQHNQQHSIAPSIGSGSAKLVSGRAIPPKVINDELIKIAAQLGHSGCDTKMTAGGGASFASPYSSSSSPTGDGGSTASSSPYPAAASVGDASSSGSSNAASSPAATVICAHPYVNDVVSSIATVALEYFRIRYLPYILICESLNGGASPSESSSSSSSSSSSATISAKKMSHIKRELEEGEDGGNLFITSICILAGYCNNQMDDFSDAMLSYISRRTREYMLLPSSHPPASVYPKQFLAQWLLASPLLSASTQEELVRRHLSVATTTTTSTTTFAPLSLHRVLHILRSPAAQRSPGVVMDYVVRDLLPNSFEMEFRRIRERNKKHGDPGEEDEGGDDDQDGVDTEHRQVINANNVRYICHMSTAIARCFQPSEMVGLGPALGALSALLIHSTLFRILDILTHELDEISLLSSSPPSPSPPPSPSSASYSFDMSHPLLETAEEWLLVLRTCQVAVREEFYKNVLPSSSSCRNHYYSRLLSFCGSVARARTRRGNENESDEHQEPQEPQEPQQEEQSHQHQLQERRKRPQVAEKLRTLLLSYDIVREISLFLPYSPQAPEATLAAFLSDAFINELSNNTGGDATNALFVLGLALRWRNCGCLLSKETWSNVSDQFLSITTPTSSSSSSSTSILDNVHRQDALAAFAETCSQVLRENSIDVVCRIAEKIFLSPPPPLHQHSPANEEIAPSSPPSPPPPAVPETFSWTAPSSSSSSATSRKQASNASASSGAQQALTNQRHQQHELRLTQFQLRAAPRVFRALTLFGEWNSRLIKPIVELIARTADPVVDSTVFAEVIGAAVNSKIDDSEVRKTSVEPLTTKCFVSMLKEETVERYATDEVFTKLLRVVVLAATSRHSHYVDELTNRLSALPIPALLDVLRIVRFDLHVEKGIKRLLVECSRKLASVGIDCEPSTRAVPMSYQQICSVNSCAFVPTMVKWSGLLGSTRRVDDADVDVDHHRTNDDDGEGSDRPNVVVPEFSDKANQGQRQNAEDKEVFDVDDEQIPKRGTATVDVGKALSKVIRAGDLFVSSAAAPPGGVGKVFNHRSNHHNNLDLNQTAALLRKFDADGSPVDQDLTDQFLRIIIQRAESVSFSMRRVVALLNNLMFCFNTVPIEALLAIYRPLIHDRRASDKKAFATQLISNWCSMVRLRFGNNNNTNNSNNSTNREDESSLSIAASASPSSSSSLTCTNVSGNNGISPQVRERVRKMTIELMENVCPFLMLGDGTGSTLKTSGEDVSFAIANLLHAIVLLDVVGVTSRNTNIHNNDDDDDDDQGSPRALLSLLSNDNSSLFDFDFNRYHQYRRSVLSSSSPSSSSSTFFFTIMDNVKIKNTKRMVLATQSSVSATNKKPQLSANKINDQSKHHQQLLLGKWLSKLCGSAVERFKMEQAMRSRVVALRTSIDESDHYLNLNINNHEPQIVNFDGTNGLTSSTAASSSSSSPWASWLHDTETTASVLNNPQVFYVRYLDDYTQLKRLTVVARWLEGFVTVADVADDSEIDADDQRGSESIRNILKEFCNTFSD